MFLAAERVWDKPDTLWRVTEQPIDPTQELRLDRTQEIPRETLRALQADKNFAPGVASVPSQRPTEPTMSFEPTLRPGEILTSGQLKKPDMTLRVRLRRLRSGGRWSVAGAVFLIVCWGLWTAAANSDHAAATLALLLSFAVAVGLFGLSRLVGGVVLETIMGRTRRGAWASHAFTGLFLAAVGVGFLRTIEWVIDAWNFIRGV